MATLCTRCALRLHRSNTAAVNNATRSLSTTFSLQKAVPNFQPTSSPELDHVLLSLRDKHIVPRLLSNSERKLIFAMKNKQYLYENPQTAAIGNTEIPLQWIDQRTEIPNRRQLLKQAVDLMRDGDKADWNVLPDLLIGLKQVKKTPPPRHLAKMVRLASNAGRFGVVLQCLHRAPQTGMTMKHQEVLEAVMWAVRELGRGAEGGWPKEGLEKAIKDANELAMCLEDEDHGSGRNLQPGDPRTRPEVLAVFLELVAVYAVKYMDPRDAGDRVRVYVERLLGNIEGVEMPPSTEPAERGPQFDVLQGVPIWHGLSLAQRILGLGMPQPELAARVIQGWEAGLTSIISKLEEDGVEPGSYGEQALTVWRDCIR